MTKHKRFIEITLGALFILFCLAQTGCQKLSIELRPVKEVPSEGFIPMKQKSPSSSQSGILYVSSVPEIGLEDVAWVGVQHGPDSRKCGIMIELNDKGRDKLRDYTEGHIGERLGILINGELITAPIIKATIPSGEVASGAEFTCDEAEDIVRKFSEASK